MTVGSDNYSLLLLNKTTIKASYRPVDAIYQFINDAEHILSLPYPLPSSNLLEKATEEDQAFYFLKENLDRPVTTRLSDRFEDHLQEYFKLLGINERKVLGSLGALVALFALGIGCLAYTVNYTSILTRQPFSALSFLTAEEAKVLANRCNRFCDIIKAEKNPVYGKTLLQSIKPRELDSQESDKESSGYRDAPFFPARTITSAKLKHKHKQNKLILERDKEKEEESLYKDGGGGDNLYVMPMKFQDDEQSKDKSHSNGSHHRKRNKKPGLSFYKITETEVSDMVSHRHLLKAEIPEPITEEEGGRVQKLLGYKTKLWIGFIKIASIAIFSFLPWVIAGFLLDTQYFKNYNWVVLHLNRNLQLDWEITKLSNYYLRIPDIGRIITSTSSSGTIDFQQQAETRIIQMVKEFSYEERSDWSNYFQGYKASLQNIIDQQLCLTACLHEFSNFSSILSKSPTRKCEEMTSFGLISTITRFVQSEKEVVNQVVQSPNPKATGLTILKDLSTFDELDKLSFTIQNTIAFLSTDIQGAVDKYVDFKETSSFVLVSGLFLFALIFHITFLRRYIAKLELDLFRTRALIILIPFESIMNSKSLYNAIEKE